LSAEGVDAGVKMIIGEGSGAFGGVNFKVATLSASKANETFLSVDSMDVKVGAGPALGFSIQANPGGTVDFNVFIGVGEGAKIFSPVNVGVHRKIIEVEK